MLEKQFHIPVRPFLMIWALLCAFLFWWWLPVCLGAPDDQFDASCFITMIVSTLVTGMVVSFILCGAFVVVRAFMRGELERGDLVLLAPYVVISVLYVLAVCCFPRTTAVTEVLLLIFIAVSASKTGPLVVRWFRTKLHNGKTSNASGR